MTKNKQATNDKLLSLTDLRYELQIKLFDVMKVNREDRLLHGDPTPRLLKCHLLSEVILERLIKLAYHPNGEAILSAELSYSKKLKIASKTTLFDGYSLLPKKIVCSLKRLNKIRNRLSHKLDATITKDEAIDLFVGDIPYAVQFKPIEDVSVEYLLYHYTPFLFGNMLPKDETTEGE